MAGVGDFFLQQNNQFSLSQSLGRLAITAGRPNFELQFNILQNQILGQLSDKIDEINNSTVVNNVDVFLGLEKKRLERVQPQVDQYANDALFNYKSVIGLISDLDTLTTLASGTDATAFDNFLATLNKDVMHLKRLNGYTIGFNVSDGLDDQRRNGLGINSFSSYADSATRAAAVTDAQSKLTDSVQVLLANVEAADNFKSQITDKLTSLSLQIQSVQAAQTTDKLAEIKALREKHAQYLEALSVAFEVNQQRADTLTNTLLQPPTLTQGTVLDLLA